MVNKKVSKSGMADYTPCFEFCSPMQTEADFPTVKWTEDKDGNFVGKCQSCGTIYNYKTVDYEV